ncbi:hypothetical protein EC912_10999 [Luteibacter rhizovicinus]|uniref:Uncharacterized protein n=1 Tax=Luteibacter rhizovicinus TaxID=242606 RepID=A0A4R3YLD6_9GAMM|nr:hypothetical protein [Luteibacter rhizovicinus]TCV91864.1 hypothetical protein EC912_10999 [Luteibacter rhizovicinus]
MNAFSSLRFPATALGMYVLTACSERATLLEHPMAGGAVLLTVGEIRSRGVAGPMTLEIRAKIVSPVFVRYREPLLLRMTNVRDGYCVFVSDERIDIRYGQGYAAIFENALAYYHHDVYSEVPVNLHQGVAECDGAELVR